MSKFEDDESMCDLPSHLSYIYSELDVYPEDVYKGENLYEVCATILIDQQNVNTLIELLNNVQSIEADDYPYSFNQAQLNFADCYASSYLYEGMFGNERAVELANEGFRKFVKDRIRASMDGK